MGLITSARVGHRTCFSPNAIRPGSTMQSAARHAITQAINIRTLYGFTYFFHNALLNNNKTVKISRRPMSMTKVAVHLATVG